MTSTTDGALTGASEPALPSGHWSVDRERSEIGFAVKEMWGMRTVRGVFRTYYGSMESRAGRVSGQLTIEAASLDTENERRDQHLRSPTFFDVERNRRLVFRTTSVERRDGGLTVAGELAVGSSQVPIEIPVSVSRIGDDTLLLEGTATVSRKAAGLGWNKLGAIRDDAVLHARLMLERTAGPAGSG
jgi:polyisoprenoid-binding protein YceI